MKQHQRLSLSGHKIRTLRSMWNRYHWLTSINDVRVRTIRMTCTEGCGVWKLVQLGCKVLYACNLRDRTFQKYQTVGELRTSSDAVLLSESAV